MASVRRRDAKGVRATIASHMLCVLRIPVVPLSQACPPEGLSHVHRRLASLSCRYSLRDRRLYRVPQVYGRYHYTVLCDTMLQGRVFSKEAREAERQCNEYPRSAFAEDVTDAELLKIHTASIYWGTYHLYLTGGREFAAIPETRELYRDTHKYLHNAKPYDIFMAANGRSTVDGEGRKALIEALQGLTRPGPEPLSAPIVSKSSVCCGRGLVADTGLQPPEYFRLLSSSKIVICGWGLGERTACDDHAILAGAILMKPYSGFVEAFPDVYNPASSLYVPFNPDLSDFREVVARVLRNYHQFDQTRFLAQKLLVTADQTATARHFWRTVVRSVAVATNGTFGMPPLSPTLTERQWRMFHRANGSGDWDYVPSPRLAKNRSSSAAGEKAAATPPRRTSNHTIQPPQNVGLVDLVRNFLGR